MGKSSFRFLTTLTAILLLYFAANHQGYSQKFQSLSDSLSSLVVPDKADTGNIKRMNELSWELMYFNPDTAILIANKAQILGLKLLDSPATQKDTLLRKTCLHLIARSNNILGVCYEFKGEYSTSLLYHNRSYKIRESVNDKLGMGMSMNNIGNVYESKGDYIRALHNYLESSKLFTDVGDIKRIGGSYNNIGIIYLRLTELALAHEYFEKALRIFQYLKNIGNQAQVYTNIGLTYESEKNNDMAIVYYNKALELEKVNQNVYNIAILYNNMGNAYKAKNENDTALSYYFKALRIHEELGLTYGVASNLGSIGSIYLFNKKYAEAESYLKKALELSKEIGALDLNRTNYEWLTRLASETNNYKEAFEYHVQLSLTRDSLFNDEKSKELGKLEAKYEIEMQAKEKMAMEKAELERKIKAKRRRDLLQYSGIVIILFVFAMLILLLGFVKVKPAIASGLIFFAFLLLFEFLLVLLDPTIDRYSRGEPGYKLLFNAAIAALIFPVHAFFEKILRKRIIRP